MKFEQELIGNHIITLKGFAFKSSWYTGTGVAIVKVSDFTQDSVSADKVSYIAIESIGDFEKYKLVKGDILIQTVGSWEHNPNSVVGKVVRIPEIMNESLLNQNIVKIIPKETLDKSFLFYLLRSDVFKGYIIKTAQGSANQASITLDSIRAFKFKYKDKLIQQKISSILLAYDDLIENNLKRIKLLEEKAFLRYKEILKSEKLEKFKLNEVTQILKRGISPKYVEEDGIVVFNQKCIRNHIVSFGDARLTGIEKKIPKERLLQKYDTLINSTGAGTLGRIAMNIQDEISATVDSHITIVRANEKVTPVFLSQSLLAQENIIENMGEGSTNQTELSPRKLGEEIKISIPEKSVMMEFEKQSVPNFNLIWNLQKQNTKLREARDILLPRLMSGEIVV